MESLLIGLLYIVLWCVIAAIIVWIIIYGAAALGFPLPAVIQKLLWVVVALIALIMLVQLLLSGVPLRPFR